MFNKNYYSIVMFFFIILPELFGQVYNVKSPDGKLEIKVAIDDTVKWSVYLNREEFLKPGIIFMNLNNNISPGLNPSIINVKENSIDEIITALIPVKNSSIKNICNELSLEFRNNYKITFRAYNDGAAYRFETYFDKDINVSSEYSEFNFNGDAGVFFPEEKSKEFYSHYERSYKDTLLKSFADSQYCSLPVLVYSGNKKILITEADLYDYPNMFLSGTGKSILNAVFPKVILESKSTGDRDEEILRQADYIAKTKGTRTFPWRIVVITENDKDLLETEMVYKLSSPPASKNTGWIIPGRVAWDWWNDLNIYGVDFQSGINTAAYKYYIDFASSFGLEYIILDEGWSLTTHNLLQTTPALNLPELISYGKEKNVGIILWVLWNALDKNMEPILDSFAVWGIKGIKVDFMQRADQDMVNFYEKCASAAFQRNLVVDFHGAYKPAGLNRKYPNVLSFEGVKGLEWSKWSSDVTPGHDVTLPFIRMAAGPMDFTPGAMINASRESFRSVFSQPMSQGTRCHQAAMYVIYTSPLQMFCDNPSNYLKDSVYTKFISRIPSVWDETVGLNSKVGDYVSSARRRGTIWYIGAMTDWNSRKLEIELSFLEEGEYTLEYLQDGLNAAKHASDYKYAVQKISSKDKLKIEFAPGGGWVGILTKK